MASAYAAVVSIVHLMDHVQLYHARQPIFLDEQLSQLESIKQIVTFLQNYFEDYHQAHGGSQEMNDLESRMTNAACTIEDIIESYIVEDVFYGSMKIYDPFSYFGLPSTSQRMISSNDFSQSLQKAIEQMDFIKREVMLIKEKSKVKDHQPRDRASTTSIGAPHIGNAKTVELDDNVVKLMEKLTREQPSLQIIPITGMGGIGKTTLAKNTYDNRLIVKRFDLRGWITITPNYNIKDLLIGLLLQTGFPISEKEKKSNEYHQLGEKLFKHLWSRMYLIILDDIWSIKAWDELKLFFPDNKNGSRIMITTRLSYFANNFDYSNIYEMKLLDEKESWTLFCKMVFVHEDCPPELEEVGKKIAKSCKGLPLSIVVIAGLLVMSKIREYWEYVANDISTIINSDDDERCLKILSLSYHNLSIHLKPCFLYMGVYPEDYSIHISDLIKLWIAEGFLKPRGFKSLEEVAEDYLKDLIGRNLIFVSKFGSTGNMKYCKIHDLLRDLCLREAKKERFFHTMKVGNYPPNMNNERRIAVMPPITINFRFIAELQSPKFIRSIICHFVEDMSDFVLYEKGSQPKFVGFRLVRVWRTPASSIYIAPSLLDRIRHILNLRYVNCNYSPYGFSDFPPWNLQIVSFIHCRCKQFDIWKMQQLRHVNILGGVALSDPPCCKIDDIVLENLQTLADVFWFRCTEEVVKRIPSIKKLKIRYPFYKTREDISDYCLNNLGHLQKLQSLSCDFEYFKDLATESFVRSLNFPDSLKKLSLKYYGEGITTKIGSLPHLEKLVLNSCDIGEEWNTVEGQFISLKYLEIIDDDNLVEWTVDSTHFPCLECLVLTSVQKLNGIPSGIGETMTLRLIKLANCSRYVVTSAKEILKEQQSNGNEDFHLVVRRDVDDEE